MKHLQTYKANRVYDDTFLGGPFFAKWHTMIIYFKKVVQKQYSTYPQLEADDCLAIVTKNIVSKYPKANIYIITSDMDYLQLARDNVHIYDLKFKKLTEKKSSFNDPEKDLFVKILTGDKSDNISGVFKKCGPKTACKYYDDKELFKTKLENVEGAINRYLLNKKMIDFNEIPENLIKEFKTKYIYIIKNHYKLSNGLLGFSVDKLLFYFLILYTFILLLNIVI